MRRLGVRVRAASTFAFIAICLTLLARTNAGVARLPFPNPLGNAQDVAVRAALSEFGKAVGAQLPIVLSPSDALATANLPGPPFAPGTTPNITRSLRASTDGTVALQPGDYEFTVDVFCMKATAHSPAAHRYLVAPLRGAAADIFSALNSRAPSYHPNHIALQVLSWDIQGGLPYGEMQAPQRALVDQIIPDYRQRLEGDVLSRIQAKYQEIVGRVPGMPSFDGALSRIGQVGQDVIAMRQLRQQLAQPPPTVAELVRELVPFAPLEPGGSGPTPWSRYSDQVYVRFTTSGNFATPGTYQVRVLAPNQVGGTTMLALGPPGSGAPVPFSNIVNNPGTSSVQPLTQGPQAGHGPTPSPSPTPTPAATITSQTYAPEPADRSRLTVGVGEPVKLTFSGKSATWSLSGSGGKISPNGKTCEYTASITAATETITAVDTTTNAKGTITFDVITPSGLYFERVTGTLTDPDFYHHQNWPDIGFAAKVYLKPETVSFEYIEVREQNANFMATGYYSWNDGKPHGDPSQAPETVTKLVTGKGWELEHEDSIWSGRKNGPAFTPGYESVHIPWEYTAAGNGETGPFYVFAHVWQTCEYKSNGKLTAEKGNADITLTISSPNYK
jgi:hypothetical protein